jgi:hypothetical protein
MALLLEEFGTTVDNLARIQSLNIHDNNLNYHVVLHESVSSVLIGPL